MQINKTDIQIYKVINIPFYKIKNAMTIIVYYRLQRDLKILSCYYIKILITKIAL